MLLDRPIGLAEEALFTPSCRTGVLSSEIPPGEATPEDAWEPSGDSCLSGWFSSRPGRKAAMSVFSEKQKNWALKKFGY